MKLLISAFSCTPRLGGEAQSGWNWAVQNARYGNEVWCVTTPQGAQDIAATGCLEELPQLHMVYVPVPAVPGIRVFGRFGIYVRYLAWQRAASRQAMVLHERVAFDLLHHVTYKSLQLGSWLWRVPAPLIYGPVSGGQFPPRSLKRYFGPNGWQQERMRALASRILMRFSPPFRQTMRRAALVLAGNQETLEMAQSSGARDVRLWPDFGLPESFYPRCIPERQVGDVLRLLWIGRVIPRKGLLLALEALSRVPRDVPFRLTIVGEGALAEHIPSWVEDLGLGGRVEQAGGIPWTELPEYLLRHDALLFPTLRDSFGSQMLDAMAYGLPVICLDLYGARAFIPDAAAMKISPGPDTMDIAAAVAEAVAALYRDRERYMEMSRHAASFARDATWPRRVAAMQEIYREVAASGNGSVGTHER